MTCHNCQALATKHGRHRNGDQRWRCAPCKKTFSEPRERLGNHLLDMDRVLMCLQLLLEGMSVRAVERVTKIQRDTILDILRTAGERCEAKMNQWVQNVPVGDVQCDEIWAFVGMKEKTKASKKLKDARLGDAYTFIGLERDSKLILAWHLGRRTTQHTDAFVEKLDRATAGHFQISTDGFPAYSDCIGYHLGMRTDYGMIVKKYGSEEPERRYSPPSIIGIEKNAVHGDPDPDQICTSHVENLNLNLRMQIRRLTRLTNAFSKKWENLHAMIALYVASYNFCRPHGALSGCTPAMAAGVVDTRWSLADLLAG